MHYDKNRTFSRARSQTLLIDLDFLSILAFSDDLLSEIQALNYRKSHQSKFFIF